MTPEIEYEVPTWNHVYNMLLNLTTNIRKSSFKPDVIVGICRGGWPPARVLSDLLDNPNLANVRVEFYLGVAEARREPLLSEPLSFPVEGKKVLVVDEVADTGRSLKVVKDHILQKGAAEVRTATVYCKPWSIAKPDYFVKEASHWVVFPWEIKETTRNIATKCGEKGASVEEEKAKLVSAGVPEGLVKRFLREIAEETHC